MHKLAMEGFARFTQGPYWRLHYVVVIQRSHSQSHKLREMQAMPRTSQSHAPECREMHKCLARDDAHRTRADLLFFLRLLYTGQAALPGSWTGLANAAVANFLVTQFITFNIIQYLMLTVRNWQWWCVPVLETWCEVHKVLSACLRSLGIV